MESKGKKTIVKPEIDKVNNEENSEDKLDSEQLIKDFEEGIELQINYSSYVANKLTKAEYAFMLRILTASPAVASLDETTDFSKILYDVTFDQVVVDEQHSEQYRLSKERIIEAIESLSEKGIVEYVSEYACIYIDMVQFYRYFLKGKKIIP